MHVPPIPRGNRRFSAISITYVNELGFGKNQGIVEEYGCCLCLSHFPEINLLHLHIYDVHVKQNNDQSEEDGNTNATLVSIATDSGNSIDCSATHNIYEQLSRDYLKLLERIVTVALLSNKCLNKKMRDEVTNENQKQRELHTLQSFTNVHAFLLAALEQSLGTLPRWIWTLTNEDIANISHEYQILQASKFILTTFADSLHTEKTAENQLGTNILD